MSPILIDFFCCEGGASEGYARAGFQVYGVDNQPRPKYPFPFHQGDAIEVMDTLLAGEAVPFVLPGRVGLVWVTLDMCAAWAGSPPCQAYSKTRNAYDSDGKHPELVEPTRERFKRSRLPYVIENVEGAPLLDPLTLCGTEFGLTARDIDGELLSLRRHRLFESNVFLMGAGGCDHNAPGIVAGVYSGSRHNKPAERDNPARRGGYAPRGPVAGELLGIDWMSQKGREQAIPPAYTEHIGAQLLHQMAATA